MHYSVCDYVSEAIANSVEAGSSFILCTLIEDCSAIRVCIADNGKGMTAEELQKVSDPFYSEEGKHCHRKAGLGVAFIKQASEQCGGNFDIKSEKNKGTSLLFEFSSENIDTPPLGDLTLCLLQAVTFSGEYELVFERSRQTEEGKKEYQVQRSQLQEALGELESASSQNMLRDYLQNLEMEIQKETING